MPCPDGDFHVPTRSQGFVEISRQFFIRCVWFSIAQFYLFLMLTAVVITAKFNIHLPIKVSDCQFPYFPKFTVSTRQGEKTYSQWNLLHKTLTSWQLLSLIILIMPLLHLHILYVMSLTRLYQPQSRWSLF